MTSMTLQDVSKPVSDKGMPLLCSTARSRCQAAAGTNKRNKHRHKPTTETEIGAPIIFLTSALTFGEAVAGSP